MQRNILKRFFAEIQTEIWPRGRGYKTVQHANWRILCLSLLNLNLANNFFICRFSFVNIVSMQCNRLHWSSTGVLNGLKWLHPIQKQFLKNTFYDKIRLLFFLSHSIKFLAKTNQLTKNILCQFNFNTMMKCNLSFRVSEFLFSVFFFTFWLCADFVDFVDFADFVLGRS